MRDCRRTAEQVWLADLTIRNLAIIDEVEVSFQPGFNVLTGETGAGKSIIIQAIGFLFGERADTDLIRSGEEVLSVSARFCLKNFGGLSPTLEELGLDAENGELILHRELWRSGRGRCRVNGQLVTVGQLKAIGKALIDIHGQHAHQSLLDRDTHLSFLDAFAGPPVAELKERYKEHYRWLLEVEKELKELQQRESDRARQEDLLRYQIAEIESAQLERDEEERLLKERQILLHSERLVAALSEASEAVSGDRKSLDLLGDAVSALKRASEIDTDLTSLYLLLQQAFDQAQEVGFQISRYLSNADFDPNRLEEVEARLDLISRLKKKYGPDIPSILQYAERIKADLTSLETQEERIGQLEKERGRLRRALAELAWQLSAERAKAAAHLERTVLRHLKPLAMEKTRLTIALIHDEAEDGLEKDGKQWAFGPDGIDRVEILIAPNPGEPFKPLSKIASGGELSRTMLALKVSLQDRQQIPILAFDEVDVGIGGRAAAAVGEKLREIGQFAQVLCVTHLPQIACQAHWHLFVEKNEVAGRTRVSVRPLAGQERVHELARMISGREVTAGSLSHAQEMLQKAQASPR